MKKSLKTINFSSKKNFWLKIIAFLFVLFILIDSVIFSAPTMVSADIRTGLKAHYKFDEGSGVATTTDSSGMNNNGTVLGAPIFNTGKISNMLNFDGINDYVNVANNSSLNPTGDMTLSAWVKFEQLGTEVGRYQKIIYKGHDVAPWESYELMMDENNQIVFTRAGSDGNYAGAGYSGSVSKGVWYHIVGISQGQTMKIHINGADSTSWSYNNVLGLFLQSSNLVLRMGNSPWNSEYFKGALDDVRIYNRALTISDIAELYNYDGLVAHYRFDEGSGTSVNDSSPNVNNGVIINGATFSLGMVGSSTLNFDGVDDYASIAYNPSFGIRRDITISAWIKRNNISRYDVILSKTNGTTRWNYDFFICDLDCQPGDDGKIILYSDGKTIPGSTGKIIDTEWHHIVVTRSVNDVRYYIDGADAGGGTMTGGYFGNNSDPVTIGTDDNGVNSFDGKIDDVRVYTRALTASEINELYTSVINASSSSSSSSSSPSISNFFPAPQNFGVGISFASPTDPATTLFWKAPSSGGTYPPLSGYEAENLGEWGQISLSTTTLYYTDENVSNGTYYIYEVAAVYEDTGTLTYKSEPVSILIRVPTAEECQCEVWQNCPYQTNVETYKYAVNFMSQLRPSPSPMATSSSISFSNPAYENLPAGDYRVKLVSAFKNFSPNQEFPLLDNRWRADLKDADGAPITQTTPSSNFSDYNSTPYYAYKNEIVNESLSIPTPASFSQAVWTGVPIYGTAPEYNQINAVCAYFEKIDPATGLPYTGGGDSQVSIDSFTATPSPVNNGSTTVLSWTSTNADYCSASGGWSGFKNLSGTATTTPIYGTTIFGLKCVSADGESEVTTSVSVSVNSSENTITSVNCQPSPNVANIGQQITWTVNPIPFSALYTYSWSGDDSLSGSGQTVTKTYLTTGTKTATVNIGGATNPQQCVGKVRITASPSFDEL